MKRMVKRVKVVKSMVTERYRVIKVRPIKSPERKGLMGDFDLRDLLKKIKELSLIHI